MKHKYSNDSWKLVNIASCLEYAALLSKPILLLQTGKKES
jgi:hypothetical protein